MIKIVLLIMLIILIYICFIYLVREFKNYIDEIENRILILEQRVEMYKIEQKHLNTKFKDEINNLYDKTIQLERKKVKK